MLTPNSWYLTVVRLYPFTGWPQEQFKLNIEKLLDKAIIAVITKNEVSLHFMHFSTPSSRSLARTRRPS